MAHVNAIFNPTWNLCSIFKFISSISSTWNEPNFSVATLVIAFDGCGSFDSFAV
jgi:hypothetical protein